MRSKGNGDDTLLCWRFGYGLAFRKIQSIFRDSFGMKVTTPAKTEDDSGKDRLSTVHEVSFCSRTFVQSEGCPYWQSQLKPDAIASALTFTQLPSDDPDGILEQLEATLHEVTSYGEEAYEMVAKSITSFARYYRIEPSVISYAEALKTTRECIENATSTWVRGEKEKVSVDSVIDGRFRAIDPPVPLRIPSASEMNTAQVTTSSTTPFGVSSTRKVQVDIRAWRKRFNSESPRPPLSSLVEMPDFLNHLAEADAPYQTVKADGKSFSIPQVYSAACFKYVLLEGVPSPDVLGLANTTHPMSRVAAALEQLRGMDKTHAAPATAVWRCLIRPGTSEVAECFSDASDVDTDSDGEPFPYEPVRPKDGPTVEDLYYQLREWASKKEGRRICVSAIRKMPAYKKHVRFHKSTTPWLYANVGTVDEPVHIALPMPKSWSLVQCLTGESASGWTEDIGLPLLPHHVSFLYRLTKPKNWKKAFLPEHIEAVFGVLPNADEPKEFIEMDPAAPVGADPATMPPPVTGGAGTGGSGASASISGADPSILNTQPVADSVATAVKPPIPIGSSHFMAGQPIMSNNFGVQESEFTMQQGLKENVYSFACKAQYTDYQRIVTGTDRNVVIQEIGIYPWNPELLHPDAMDWALLHERFNGGFKFGVKLISTGTVLGSLGMAIIPPQYVDSVGNTEQDLSRFTPEEVSLEASSTAMVNVHCMNRDSTPLMFIQRDDEGFQEDPYKYGKIVIWTTTDTDTAYKTQLNLSMRSYFEFLPGFEYNKKAVLPKSTAAGAPIPPRDPGTLIVTDDDGVDFKVEGVPSRYIDPAFEAATGTYAPVSQTSSRDLFAWIPNGFTQIEPDWYVDNDTNDAYDYAWLGAASFKSGPILTATGTSYIGTYVSYALFEDNEVTERIENNVQAIIRYKGTLRAWSDTSKCSVITQKQPRDPSEEWDWNFVTPAQEDYVAAYVPKYAPFSQRIQPKRPFGVIGIVFGVDKRDSGTAGLSLAAVTARQNGVVPFPVTNDGVYCDIGTRTSPPSDKPVAYKRVIFANPSAIIPGVLAGVRGHTIPPDEYNTRFNIDIEEFFEKNPNIAALQYRAIAGGKSIGTFIANSDGFWVSRSLLYEIFQEIASAIEWDVSISSVRWPATDTDVGLAINREIAGPTAKVPTFYKGKFALVNGPKVVKDHAAYYEKRRKELNTGTEVDKHGGLMRLMEANASVVETPEMAAVVGGALSGLGQGISAAAGMGHEKRMQDDRQKHNMRMLAMSTAAKNYLQEQQFGRYTQVMQSKTHMGTPFPSTPSSQPAFTGRTPNRSVSSSRTPDQGRSLRAGSQATGSTLSANQPGTSGLSSYGMQTLAIENGGSDPGESFA